MDNIKNDHYYLEKVKTDIGFIVAHMKDVDLQVRKGDSHLVESITKFSKLICLLPKKKEAAKCCSLNDNYLVVTALVSFVSVFAKSSSIVETGKS